MDFVSHPSKSTGSAGDNSRLEVGLFDNDFKDYEVDRNLQGAFSELQGNERLVKKLLKLVSARNQVYLENFQKTDFLRGYTNKGTSKLEAKCKRQTKDLFKSNLLKDCKKINGWQRRVEHLLDDLTRMKNTCQRIIQEK